MGKITPKITLFGLALSLASSLIFLLLLNLAAATTLTGTIYNEQLEPETNVLVEIGTERFLARDGTYTFELPPGSYLITAQKEEVVITEEVKVGGEEFIFDIFLIPGLEDEDDLWRDTEEELFEEEDGWSAWLPARLKWQYIIAALIVIFSLYRFFKFRKKYGPLGQFRRRMKEEAKKTIEQHKEELAREPDYLDKALEIIRKHDGRLTQKELRKEMLYISEAKVSLILTELEHKGLVERIKKGRGKVIILR